MTQGESQEKLKDDGNNSKTGNEKIKKLEAFVFCYCCFSFGTSDFKELLIIF
jgi:hypothetical protein